jgi:hypothetical protein
MPLNGRKRPGPSASSTRFLRTIQPMLRARRKRRATPAAAEGSNLAFAAHRCWLLPCRTACSGKSYATGTIHGSRSRWTLAGEYRGSSPFTAYFRLDALIEAAKMPESPVGRRRTLQAVAPKAGRKLGVLRDDVFDDGEHSIQNLPDSEPKVDHRSGISGPTDFRR